MVGDGDVPGVVALEWACVVVAGGVRIEPCGLGLDVVAGQTP